MYSNGKSEIVKTYTICISEKKRELKYPLSSLYIDCIEIHWLYRCIFTN